MNWLDELLFPSRCPVCFDIVYPRGTGICEACKDKLKAVREPRCLRCGRQLAHMQEEYCMDCSKKARAFIRGVVGFDYDSVPVKTIISEVKYHNKRQLLDEPCKIFAGNCEKIIKRWELQCLIPVPLHTKRQRKRGFNQAEEISRRLSACLDIPTDSGILRRVHFTKPQKELSEMQRMQNLMQAFAADENNASGLHCVALVDDIFTTGSTIEACTYALKKVGIDKIYSICLASGSQGAGSL